MTDSLPFPVVLSAPSGGGKTAVCSLLMKSDSRLGFSITCTTREPRPDEKHGRDYYFLTRKEFREAMRSGALLEWAEVHGNFYGTPKKSVEKLMAGGRYPVMTIDVKGAGSVKKNIPGTVTVFLLPPDKATLLMRLRKRKESAAAIAVRLKTAEKELKKAKFYDYIVTNGDIGRAVRDILCIINAEKLRTGRRITAVRKNWEI